MTSKKITSTAGQMIDAAIAEALEYAREDEDSPKRAARYWLLTDLQGQRYEMTPEQMRAAILQTLAIDRSDAECVAICRTHGVEI